MVIVILAILAAIVVSSAGSSSANAANSSCLTDAKTLSTALEEYNSAVGVFPGDISLQVTGASNPFPQPLSNFGQTWSIVNPAIQPPGIYGVLGNTSTSNGIWTAPNGQAVGPFMRQLPTTQHYKILTDGQGGVFVYPASAHVPTNGATMDGQLVSSVLPSSGDSKSLNFGTDPGICSDPNVVK